MFPTLKTCVLTQGAVWCSPEAQLSSSDEYSSSSPVGRGLSLSLPTSWCEWEVAAPFPGCTSTLILPKALQGPPLTTGLCPSSLVVKALDAFLYTPLHDTLILTACSSFPKKTYGSPTFTLPALLQPDPSLHLYPHTSPFNWAISPSLPLSGLQLLYRV